MLNPIFSLLSTWFSMKVVTEHFLLANLLSVMDKYDQIWKAACTTVPYKRIYKAEHSHLSKQQIESKLP